MSLVIDAVGPQVLVQDTGRFGYSNLAISASGAMDGTAHRLANRLVGNTETAATLEILMGGFRSHATEYATVALTGAAAEVTVNGRHRPMAAPLLLHPGDEVSVGQPSNGLRTYLAVRGGFDVPPVLGSRASDPTTGIGPAPVCAGDLLEIGALIADDVPQRVFVPPLHRTDVLELSGTWGPRADWFTPAARVRFTSSLWHVSAQTNRVGVRLEGGSLERSVTGELPSEGLVRGAVQVPANGEPLVFANDHPTTGGYPVIGVVDETSVDKLAQARPGTAVRFRMRTLPTL